MSNSSQLFKVKKKVVSSGLYVINKSETKYGRGNDM